MAHFFLSSDTLLLFNINNKNLKHLAVTISRKGECVLLWLLYAVKEGPHDTQFLYKRKEFVLPNSYSLNPLA